MDVNNVFGLMKNDIVSVVGAGGKTSLILYLAEKLRGKILISPSTRMYQPKEYPYLKSSDFFFFLYTLYKLHLFFQDL